MSIDSTPTAEAGATGTDASNRLSPIAQVELLRHAPVGLMTIDRNGKVLAHNLMLARWRGYSREVAAGALIGDNALNWLSAESRERCLAMLNHDGDTDLEFREVVIEGSTLGGEFTPIILNADVVTNGDGELRAHVALIDATERGRFEQELLDARRSADRANEQLHILQEQLRHQALHDSLTGLPNQALLEEQLGRILLSSTRSERPCAAIYLDIDGFRSINRTFGHAVGDELLRVMAKRLREVCPPGGIVSRLGGDEFVLAGGPTDEAALALLAERVLEQVRMPVRGVLEGRTLSASIGAVIWAPRPGEGAPHAREFIAAADQTMYEAKQAGRNTVAQRMWSDFNL